MPDIVHASGVRRPFLWLGIAALAVAAVCLAAYLGACATLVPGDTGGKGEVVALVMAVIFGAAGLAALQRHRSPAS